MISLLILPEIFPFQFFIDFFLALFFSNLETILSKENVLFCLIRWQFQRFNLSRDLSLDKALIEEVSN